MPSKKWCDKFLKAHDECIEDMKNKGISNKA